VSATGIVESRSPHRVAGDLSRRASGALAALALALASVRPSNAARGQSLSMSLGLASVYDDNLLQYSSNQRDLFLSGTKPDRFSIHTLDDLTWSPQVGLTWTLDRGAGRRRSLRAHFSGDLHSKNSTADLRSASLSLHESFQRGHRISLGYYTVPKYYLRQLIAEDYVPPFPGLSRYHRAEFGLDIGSIAWEHALGKRLDLGLAYQLENRGYNSDFRERDSKTHQARLSLLLSGPDRGNSLGLLAGYRWDLAKGEDGDEPEAPPDADISYHGPIAGVEGRMQLTRSRTWRLSGEATYWLGYRGYDSNRPGDPYHFGRSDVIQTVESGLRLALRPHWTLRGFYRFESSDARLGSTAPPTSDVGSYRQQQVGVGVEWSYAIWRQSRHEESDASD